MVRAAEPVTRAEPRRLGRFVARPPVIPWLIIAAYLLAAVAVTARVWAHPTLVVSNNGRKTVENDVLLSIWFMRYAATALTHGHLPALITTAVNAPQGINMMWNTSMLAPGILLSPVTLTAGPVASLAVLETVGFAGSAAALFWVLRRWGASLTAAAVGGALYGFCPALMVAANDHYQLQFAVLPPLIIDAVLRLATGRANRPVRTGIWLGVLVALQFFTGEELLVLTVIVGAVILAVLAVQRRSEIRQRFRPAGQGLLVAIGVFLVTCGYALLIQLRGPLAQTGSPWRIARYGNHAANFVTPPLPMLLHGNPASYYTYLHNTGQWPVEVYAYLGWPLLIALIVAIVACWRDLKIRTAGVALIAVDLLSLGGHRQRFFGVSVPGGLLPWHYLMKLPLIGDVVIVRISILADSLAAVVIAFTVDRVLAAIGQQRDWRKPVFACAAGAALAAIVVPIFPRFVFTEPVTQPPPGWTAVIAQLNLPRSAPVLVLPFNKAETMSWQAITDTPISLVGGYCMARARDGHAGQCGNANVWTNAETQTARGFSRLLDVPAKMAPPELTAIAALRQWKPAAVVVYGGSSPLSRYLVTLLGPPTASNHGVFGWRLLRHWWVAVYARYKASHVLTSGARA